MSPPHLSFHQRASRRCPCQRCHPSRCCRRRPSRPRWHWRRQLRSRRLSRHSRSRRRFRRDQQPPRPPPRNSKCPRMSKRRSTRVPQLGQLLCRSCGVRFASLDERSSNASAVSLLMLGAASRHARRGTGPLHGPTDARSHQLTCQLVDKSTICCSHRGKFSASAGNERATTTRRATPALSSRQRPSGHRRFCSSRRLDGRSRDGPRAQRRTRSNRR